MNLVTVYCCTQERREQRLLVHGFLKDIENERINKDGNLY